MRAAHREIPCANPQPVLRLEATGSISQHLFKSFGFREVLTARYCDVVFGNRRPFASIKEPVGTILMEKEL